MAIGVAGFDTIYFDKKYACPLCQGKIDSVQVKEFENLLENYHDRGYEFGIKMVSLEQARASGLIKKLKEIDIESEKRQAVPIERAIKELKEEENKRIASVIERGKDRKRSSTIGVFMVPLCLMWNPVD